jgi:thymidylate kinase
VALMGQDGTGKTTISRILEKKLEGKGKKVQLKRGFDYFILHFFTGSSSPRAELVRDEFFRKSGKLQGIFLVWPYLVWLDFVLQKIFLEIFKRDSIVLFDRYVGDSLTGWEYFGYSSRIIRWLYLHFPKTFLCFVLDVPPEIGVQRKEFENIPDSDVETLKKQMRFVGYINPRNQGNVSENAKREVLLRFYAIQRKRYLALSHHFYARLIDTSKPIEIVVSELYKEIEKYAKSRTKGPFSLPKEASK